MIEAMNWKSFVVLYEESDGLVRLQEVLKLSSVYNDLQISVRQLIPSQPGDDYRYIVHYKYTRCLSKNLVVDPIFYYGRLWVWTPNGHNLEQWNVNWFSSYQARAYWFSTTSQSLIVQPAPKYMLASYQVTMLSKDILSSSRCSFWGLGIDLWTRVNWNQNC